MRTPSGRRPEAPPEEADRLDLLVPDGCPLCDGPMELRVTPTTAWALCAPCEYLAQPSVAPDGPGRYELNFFPTSLV